MEEVGAVRPHDWSVIEVELELSEASSVWGFDFVLT